MMASLRSRSATWKSSVPRVAGLAAIAAGVAISCSSDPDTTAGATTGGGNPAGTGANTGGDGGAATTGTTTGTAGGGGVGAQGGAGGNGGSGGGGECVAGTIVCEGAVKKVCDGNGGFTDEEDCALSGLVCAPNLGCVTCVPGTGSCNGNVGTSCKLDGSGTVEETCEEAQGTTCNPGTGQCDGACSAGQLGTSYIGCDYYPTVTANLVEQQFSFAVAVSNTTATAATVTTSMGAGIVSTVTVAPNSVQVIELPWQNTLKGPSIQPPNTSIQDFPASVRVTDGAYRLQSTQPVTVYQFSPLHYTINGSFSYSNDASLLLPVNVWTGTYRVASRHNFFVSRGFYAVTASEDGTTVTVTAGPTSGLVKAGVPGIGTNGNGTVTLDAGDVIEVVTDGDPNSANSSNDVTGTLISADKPVQVIGGHQCIYIPSGVAACDHLEESIFPYETLSNEYLVTAPLVPNGGQNAKVEVVRIVATQPNTTLVYDPPQAGAPAAIGEPGGWVEIQNTNASFSIVSNQPVLVVQYMEGQDAGGNSGDPAMALAVAKDQYRDNYLFHAPTNYEYSYVNVVAPTGAQVILDGAALAGFTPIGGTGYSVARTPVSNAGDGNHVITGSMPFGVSVYGYGQYTSYWYPGGSDLKELHR